MEKNILMAIAFCGFVALACFLWNKFMMTYYKKDRLREQEKARELFSKISFDDEQLQLAGVGDDGNSDYEFKDVVEGISLSKDVRVRLND